MISGFTRPTLPLQGVGGGDMLGVIWRPFSTFFPGDFLPQDPGVSHFYGVSGCPLIGQMITIEASDWPSSVLII